MRKPKNETSALEAKVSRYDALIALKRRRRETARNKRRADGLREYLAYKRGEELVEEAPPPRPVSTTPQNQPDNWSFLDE